MGQIERLAVDEESGPSWARSLSAWCPAAEAAGREWLENTDLEALARHARECPPCRAEITLAAAFADPAALRGGVGNLEVERIRRRLEQPRPRARRLWLSAAAVAAVALATVTSWGPPELAVAPPTQVWRSTGVEWRWAASGDLEWEPIVGAQRYRLLVQDAAGATVTVETVDQTRFEIGDTVSTVQIDALDAAGRLLARGQATVTSEQR